MSWGVWHSESGFCKLFDVDRETAEKCADAANNTAPLSKSGCWYADEVSETDLKRFQK